MFVGDEDEDARKVACYELLLSLKHGHDYLILNTHIYLKKQGKNRKIIK